MFLRHGYGIHVFTIPFIRSNAHGKPVEVKDGWGKPSAAYEVLTRIPEDKWVWWVDSDLLIMDFNTKYVRLPK